MVLYGHRSIVNQVRYNSQKCLIASSGVEKVIKLWRPFELEGWTGGLEEETNGPTNARDIFSHEEYMSLFNVSGQNMTHDYSDQNTTEDPRMMAFFDSLVQREIEQWNTDDDNSSDSDKSSCHSSDGSSRPTSTLQSESDSTTSLQIRGRGKFVFNFYGFDDRRGKMGDWISASDFRTDALRQNRVVMKARKRYLNRIAYLIATKRNTLKRLALKGSVQIRRRVKSSANRKLQQHRSSVRGTRKSTGKRMHRSVSDFRMKTLTKNSINFVYCRR